LDEVYWLQFSFGLDLYHDLFNDEIHSFGTNFLALVINVHPDLAAEFQVVRWQLSGQGSLIDEFLKTWTEFLVDFLGGSDDPCRHIRKRIFSLHIRFGHLIPLSDLIILFISVLQPPPAPAR